MPRTQETLNTNSLDSVQIKLMIWILCDSYQPHSAIGIKTVVANTI